MTVSVRLFARARELAGVERLQVDLPAGSTVGDLRQTLGEQTATLRPLVPQLLVAVGTDYATDDMVIPEGSEVACFPPVSGG
ncbi:MAG: molybdopterin converting factor subunit 1 [Planctomycetaceae bacterium]|nr:molybdopterin converting factor subunit 1 [Planctomycetaceae bacterium]